MSDWLLPPDEIAEPDPETCDAFDRLAVQRAAEEYERHRRNGGQDDSWVREEPESGPAPAERTLRFVTAAEHAAIIDARPPRTWLARPVWPSGDYGVVAAEDKAGKSFAMLDLAISVASGTPWLQVFSTEQPGPVTLFLGEGGEAKTLRRARAICASRGLVYEDLPLRLCFRVPHLTVGSHLLEMRAELEDHPPKLVIIDPLYLAARGAKGSQLYDMGEHLSNAQAIVQSVGAALVVAHHWNQTGTGHGRERMSGAGPAEWGRVLVSASVKSKHTDPATKATTVTLDLIFIGDEIPDTTVRIRRRVWTDDPDDLSSTMHYAVEELHEEPVGDPRVAALRPAHRRVLAALEAAEDWLTAREIGDAVAVDDTGLGGLKGRTVQDAAKALVEAELAEVDDVPGSNAHRWRAQPRAQHDDVRNPPEESNENLF